MSDRPRLLDLFCGAGGASTGYHRAGFDVVGVDHRPQPRYPFEFVEADAFEWTEWTDFAGFDAVHAAPLWHRWSNQARSAGTADQHPDDVADARTLLRGCGLPFVLEVGTLSPDSQAVTICGVSCGLEVVRHMRFETNWTLLVPPCSHRHGGCVDGLYVPFRRASGPAREALGWRVAPRAGRVEWREAADLGWMNWREADLASPPAYTELIGHQLMQHVQARSAA